jgi:hypothetical protein
MKTKNLLLFALCLMASFAFSQDDPFAGRPTSAGPDVASDKDNIPVKKETFASKLERYKSEGFKVAVYLYSGEITTKAAAPSSTTSLVTQMTLKGKLPSMKNDFTPLVEGFIATMNETFSTDVFEIVDMSTIPYKEAKWGKVDDWGATKYKMVVTYSATPVYDYTLTSGKYSAELTVNLNVIATEFVNEKKGVKMKYPIRAGNLGFYKSPGWESESDPGLKSIDELHTLVNPPMGADLLAELQKEQDEKMDKFIEKRKK